MLSYEMENVFKSDYNSVDVIPDLTWLDWDSSSLMEKLSQHDENVVLCSDEEDALDQLSQLIGSPLLDTLLNEHSQTSTTPLPTSRQYDVLLGQQQYSQTYQQCPPLTIKKPSQQYSLQKQNLFDKQVIEEQIYQQQQKHHQTQHQQQHLQHHQQQHPQQHPLQQQQQHQQQNPQQQQQQQQQHLGLPNSIFPLTECTQHQNTNFNYPTLQHTPQLSDYSQAVGTYFNDLNQTSIHTTIEQFSTITHDSNPLTPSKQQTSTNLPFSNKHHTSPLSKSVFHPMSTSNIQSQLTHSSPHHSTYDNPIRLPTRNMPDMAELSIFFSNCHKQVSKKKNNYTTQPSTPSDQTTFETIKSPKYKCQGSLSDIYPLSSQYEPPGKKLRQSSLEEMRSEVADIANLEDVQSVKTPEESHTASVETTASTGKCVSKADLLCSVCGDTAACLHYGARTCEGCKGFFKRTVQKKAKYVCLEESKCLVDKRRRNRCQFCRFQKCLSVGMQREVVRMNTLKGRRGRLSSKESPLAAFSKNISSELVKIHIEKENNQKIIFSKTTKSNEQKNSERSNGKDRNNDEDDSHISSLKEFIQEFYVEMLKSLELFKQWSDRIRNFNSLHSHDQQILLESAFLELFAFQVVRSLEKNEGRFETEGKLLHKSYLPQEFQDWLEEHSRFIGSLKRLCLDPPSTAHLEALLLFAERNGLKQSDKINEMQMTLCSSLQEHISNTYDSSPNSRTPLLSHILGKLAHFRDLKNSSLQLLSSLQLTVPLPITLKNYLLDS